MQVKEGTQPNRLTLSDWMRVWFKGVLDPFAAFFNRLGLMPNTMTLVGVAVSLAAGVLIATGNLVLGGLLVLLSGPVDALDGAMARLRGEPTDFGGFVDSVTDRYSELFIFGGLWFHFMREQDLLATGLVFAAAGGSVLVSYVKARAEGVGFQAKVGILSRFERFLVLVPSLILGFPRVGLGIIAVLANFTALQRIHHVWRQARNH